MSRADRRRAGDAEVLRLRFDEALDCYQDDDDDVARLCELGVRFGRYRVVTRLRHLIGEDAYRAFLRERALPQLPIGGDKHSGFAVDEAMLDEIAATLGEPRETLLAQTVRRMIDAGSRHLAKLYVLARLSGDVELVRTLQPAFDARAAHPRAELPELVRRRWDASILQQGDDDDYNPKSAYLFASGELVIKEHLRLHLDPSRLAGYSEERELLAALAHPRIVRLLDWVAMPPHELMVLRRAPGATLDGSALPRPEALCVVTQLAETLAWLHARDVLYLDVKPQNLLFDGRDVTLVDFGMARRGRRVCSMLSTLEYVPPEMARTFESTAASDVFQLGLVTYQLLVGRHPFSQDVGVAVALANLWDEPDLDAPALGALRPLVARLLARAPADRPTAKEAHAALAAA